MLLKKLIPIILSVSLLLALAGCGSSETSEEVSTSESAASEEIASAEESAAEDSAEASAEEEYEPTVDELFDELTQESDGVFIKLQCYDRRGTPIRNGEVVITDGSEERTFETDFSGFALIDAMAVDTAYTVTIDDADEEEPAPYGSFTLTLLEADEYAGEEDAEAGSITVSVANGLDSCVDMAVTATDDDGTVSLFSLSRISAWN